MFSQWSSPGSSLTIDAKGGYGSRGGIGGLGGYCSNYDIPAYGQHHIIPRSGRGTQGGKGGDGGKIEINIGESGDAEKEGLHCFGYITINTKGGDGGRGGYNNGPNPSITSISRDYNGRTGNCDIEGWKNAILFDEEITPALPGNGGKGGNIHMDMVTDNPIQYIYADLSGGYGGEAGEGSHPRRGGEDSSLH